MEDPNDGQPGRFSWYLPLWIGARGVRQQRELRRSHRDPCVALANGVQTRRLLARVVYRVPEDLLDDVLRVRLADLDAADET
jgi:hypothetical protein